MPETEKQDMDDMQRSEWSLIDEVLNKKDEPMLNTQKGDVELDTEKPDLSSASTFKETHIDEDETKKSTTTNTVKATGNQFVKWFKIIIGILICFAGLSALSNIYEVYMLENMYGRIDDFANNPEYHKIAFQKCKDAYLSHNEIFESCIESGMDAQSCLEYFSSLIDVNKEFCRWDAKSIMKNRRNWVKAINSEGHVADILEASTNNFNIVMNAAKVHGGSAAGHVSNWLHWSKDMIVENAPDGTYVNKQNAKKVLDGSINVSKAGLKQLNEAGHGVYGFARDKFFPPKKESVWKKVVRI